MKTYVLLGSLLLVLGSAHVLGAPVAEAGVEPGSCEDASAKAAAELALDKINHDRAEGYVFGLHRLSNVHMKQHGEIGTVFYLTLDVVETNCSVLSRKVWKDCEIRSEAETPVYGQCKAAIYISKPHRVVRLYKYSCTVRPVPGARVGAMCPDCPTHLDKDSANVQRALTLSMEKFNKESGLANRFAVLNVTRATAGMAMGMYYNVEYTIQETTCRRDAAGAAADKCPFMECEFAHKGFCKGSLFNTPSGEETSVECEIYEPEAAEREKKLHLLGGETDHSHSDHHHHTHDHGPGPGSAHDHGHELALDHEHHHGHLHDHEHHHHHGHTHKGAVHNHPVGKVIVLPPVGQPMILPSFPDEPVGPVGVTLPLKPDPQIPGETEPVIESFPTGLSAQCPPVLPGPRLVEQMFHEDPEFKPAA
ncbi:histidine-rich glycoprotein-like [Mugil cephalus]|uniref:histidine-rich glycoprotein-like n=1 Tax=Mugil cephalus TaxID=48193 RepID=UPI001FB7D95D|nr:histidine-rich glycoprotein-like [Mugil cephalus]